MTCDPARWPGLNNTPLSSAPHLLWGPGKSLAQESGGPGFESGCVRLCDRGQV